MKTLLKILKSKFFLVPLVLGVGSLFTVLLGTSDNCYTTADGDLTSESVYGEYQGTTQSSACGTDLSLNYFISQGTSIFWSGFGSTIGNVQVANNSTLAINGNANFAGTLTNAGTLKVEPPAAPATPTAPTSELYNISAPAGASGGHTSEEGTTSTFTVKLKNSPALATPATPTIPNSNFFNISAPNSNVSGHTNEGGVASTFTVKLKNSPAPATPATPTIPTSNFFTFTAPTSNFSGHTNEGGAASTFTVKLKNSPELDTPETVTAPSSDFYNISAPSSAAGGHTEEGGTTSTFNVSLKAAPWEDVTVSVSSSDTAEATVSPATLTFTSANYSATQQVTVTGVNDSDIDGHEEYQISLSAANQGEATTLAGSGTGTFANGTGTAASFNLPKGITSDGTNLYVSDTDNNRIRKIVISTGEVTTLAGSGTAGFADGTGNAASFYYPRGITSDGTNLYVADESNNRIRKIVISTGVVTTLAGSGTATFADGTGNAASFKNPRGITGDGTNLYVADTDNNKIRKIVISTGVVTTLVGSGTATFADGTGNAASFYNPKGITSDGTNLYVADYGNHRIRKIVISTGVVTTLAGSGTEAFADGTGTAASFSQPSGITNDGTNLYVADYGNHRIRKIVIETGVVTTLVGSGTAAFADGTGKAASFNHPRGITRAGTNLYVADRASNRIQKIN